MFIYLNFFVVFIIVILINYKEKLNYTMKDKEFLLVMLIDTDMLH